MMSLIIFFIIFIALLIYLFWGQNDDFSFFVILIILIGTLSVLIFQPKVYFFENFDSQTIDAGGFRQLANLHKDATNILQPHFQYVIASFKGTTMQEDQEFDDNGNAIEKKKPDEVPIDKSSEDEIRTVNRFLNDLKKFDPGTFYYLSSKAREPNRQIIITEEFPV
jgi:hypothetical protein